MTMDEAFKPFRDTIVELVNQPPVVGHGPFGQRVQMTAIEVEIPLELDVTRDDGGELALGSTPPLYMVKTSVLPSFHRMRVRAVLGADLEAAAIEGAGLGDGQ